MDITADIQQAYMYLLVGNSCMESNNYERAIESFERAQTQMDHYRSPSLLLAISLVSFSMTVLHIKLTRRLHRYLDGALMISVSLFDGLSAKPCMQRVVRRKQATFFFKYWMLLVTKSICAKHSRSGFQVSSSYTSFSVVH